MSKTTKFGEKTQGILGVKAILFTIEDPIVSQQ
jgi:hypothetical protein